MKIQVHVVISGRVQGVWYRANTKQKADELGLSGWVKNTAKGTVEAVFEGEETTVNEMIAWCWNGPSLANVTRVEIKKKRRGGQFTEFSVVHE